MTPVYDRAGVSVYHGDALAVLRTLPDNSVDLVLVDPPYYNVKDDAWDRQWESVADYLTWFGAHLVELARVLKPNGSLYCFASPQMAARVEVKIAEYFAVLNHIVWVKESAKDTGTGQWSRAAKDELRSFFPQTERIIFAEQYGSDNIAKGVAGYAAQCDKLRGFIFEPLRAYLDGERMRAGVERTDIVKWFTAHDYPKYVTERHAFSTSQWELPTPENYARLRQCFHELGRQAASSFTDFHTPEAAKYHTGNSYEYLRADYEYLRADYEELRRPFSVTPQDQYTDVWKFTTVAAYPGKHPCEKPLPLLRHILQCSTRADAVVLDCFAGSGSTGLAALELDVRAILIEREAAYLPLITARCDFAAAQPRLFTPPSAAPVEMARNLELFENE